MKNLILGKIWYVKKGSQGKKKMGITVLAS